MDWHLCDKEADTFVGEVAGHVDDSHFGDIVVSFVALPSFEAGMGIADYP